MLPPPEWTFGTLATFKGLDQLEVFIENYKNDT